MPAPRLPEDRLPPRRTRARTTAASEADDASAQIVAEVDGEARDGTVIVPLGNTEIGVPRPGLWRASANNALRLGDFDTWAQKTLAPTDYDLWAEIDPTVDEINDFFVQWGDLSGVSLGESQASQRSY